MTTPNPGRVGAMLDMLSDPDIPLPEAKPSDPLDPESEAATAMRSRMPWQISGLSPDMIQGLQGAGHNPEDYVIIESHAALQTLGLTPMGPGVLPASPAAPQGDTVQMDHVMLQAGVVVPLKLGRILGADGGGGQLPAGTLVGVVVRVIMKREALAQVPGWAWNPSAVKAEKPEADPAS